MRWEVVVICATVLLFRLLDHCVRALERRADIRRHGDLDWLDSEARLERCEVGLKGHEIANASTLARLEELEARTEKNTTQLGLMNLGKRSEGGR